MRPRRTLLVASLLTALFAFGAPGARADTIWIANDGDWSNASNWDNGLPDSSGNALLKSTDATNRTVTFNTSSTPFGMNIDSTGAGLMTLRITGGALSPVGPQDFVGYDARGAVVHSGGTYSPSSLIIGNQPGSNASYTLSGTGTLSVTSFIMVGASGTGTFSQSAGTHQLGTNLNVGNSAGSSGTYNLSGSGILSVSGEERIGRTGSGIFNQTGGTNTAVGAVRIAVNPGSSGTYNLCGGILNAMGGIDNKGTFNTCGGGLVIGANKSVENSKFFNIGSLVGNGGGVLGNGGWIPYWSGIQTSTISIAPISLPIATLSNVSWVNHQNAVMTVQNTSVSYASVVPIPGQPNPPAQVSLDYELTYRNFGGYISDPSTSIFGHLINESTGYIQGGAGDEFLISGDFENYSEQTGLWDTRGALLGFVGDPGTAHVFKLSETASGFAWGGLYLALDNTLLIPGTFPRGLFFDTIYLEDITQLDDIFSNTDIYFRYLLGMNGQPLDWTGYDIAGPGRLIQGYRIPEPGSLALMCLALAGLAASRRRRH